MSAPQWMLKQAMERLLEATPPKEANPAVAKRAMALANALTTMQKDFEKAEVDLQMLYDELPDPKSKDAMDTAWGNIHMGLRNMRKILKGFT